MEPTWDITCADCRVELAAMAARGVQVDAVVTDPPYHLTSNSRKGSTRYNDPETPFGRTRLDDKGFMGKAWDGGDVAFQPETWRAVYDAMKPGAHLLVFGGTRTFHRMMVAIEDAGFELRDVIMWCYGSGFPKSHDISKGIDKHLGAERSKVPPRSIIGHQRNIGNHRPYMDDPNHMTVSDIPVTAAAAWHGWGSALKPAYEPIVMFRKPLIGTLAENVLAYGTGGLNIDGCRIDADDKTPAPVGVFVGSNIGPTGHTGIRNGNADNLGRWPANLILDGSDEVIAAFPSAPGQLATARVDGEAQGNNVYGKLNHVTKNPKPRSEADTSSARFFYHAKANAADRAGSKHPTVKPQALMRYLCRLVTPPGGTVLDPFAGSGSTLQAAVTEGFNAIGVEAEPEYCLDIMRRMVSVTGAADAA